MALIFRCAPPKGKVKVASGGQGFRPLDDDQRIGGAGPAKSPHPLRTVNSLLDTMRA